METQLNHRMRNHSRLITILSVAGILLIVPLIAMQISNEVKWTSFDFTVAGVLLFGTGLTCEIILRKVTRPLYRLFTCGAVIIILLLIWAELAVGILGTAIAGS